VVKEPRLIEIKKLECLARTKETLTIRVVCSKGTYIRTLAADIGNFLGCGAHLSTLKRTRNGFFTLGQSLPGEELISGETGRRLLESHRISLDTVKELLGPNGEEN
jgi:tRNA pseudouridine55 synthase